MASRSNNRRLGAVLAWLVAAPSLLAAQQPATPTPLRPSFADAGRGASGQAPPVELATLRTSGAEARGAPAPGGPLAPPPASGGWGHPPFHPQRPRSPF